MKRPALAACIAALAAATFLGGVAGAGTGGIIYRGNPQVFEDSGIPVPGSLVPVRLSLAPKAGVLVNAGPVLSEPAVATGPEHGFALVARGGELRACSSADCAGGGAFASSVKVASGAYVQARLAGPTTVGGVNRMTVESGSYTGTFEVSAAYDAGLDPVADVVNAEPGSIQVSTASTLRGFASTTLSVTGGEYRLNGGGWTTSASSAKAGDRVEARVAAGAFATSRTVSVATAGGGAPLSFTVSSRGQDTTPDAFALASVANAEPGALVQSAAVTPTGFDDAIAFDVAGGEASVAGGAFVSGGTIRIGQSLTVRTTASAAFGGSAAATLTLGTGAPVRFEVATRAQDTLPDAFSLASAANAEPGAVVQSAAVVPTGYEGAVPFAVAGGEASVAGGAFSGSGTIRAGQSLVLRTTAAAAFGGSATATVTVGTGAGVPFQVATRAKDTTPDAFSFPAVVAVEPGTQGVSAVVRLAGFDSADASVSGGEYQLCSSADCSDGGTWRSGPTAGVPAGSFVRVRTAALAYGEAKTTALTVGGTSASFSASSRAQDTAPDAFSVPAVAGAEPGVLVQSAAVTPSGYEGSVQIVATGGEFSLDGTTWSTSGTIVAGGSFRLRVTSATYGGSVSASVKVGTGPSATFAVATRAQDTTPDAFSLAPVAGADPSTQVVSASVVPTGYEGSVAVSASNGQVSVAGGAFAASGTIAAGQGLVVRVASSATYGATETAQVTVGTGAAVPFQVTTRAQNTTPSAYSIPAVAGAEPGVLVASSAVTPTGFEGVVQLAASNGQVSTDGGATWLASTTLTKGGSFRVRTTSSAAFAGVATAQVTVGTGAATPFQVTTRLQDTTPDAFVVASVADAAPSTQVASAAVTPVGYEGTVGLAASNGQVSVDGGSTWATSASLTAGGSFRVRTTSSASFGGTAAAQVTVGTGAAASFTVTTKAQDTLPDAFTLAAVGGAEPSTATSSASVVPTGYDGTVTVAASGGQVSVAGGAFAASASISPGQGFVVRVTSSASYGGTATASVTVGTGSATPFTVTTRSQDTTPDAFTIAAVGSANPSTVTTSAAVTPTGYEGTVTVSVTGGTSSQVSTDGGSSWATSASLTAGGSFLVRTTSSASYATASTANVTVGSGAATAFTVTTRAQDVTPDAFPFADTANAAPGYVTSAVVTPTGYDGTVGVQPSGGTSTEVSVAGGAWTSSYTYITLGQTLQLRQNIAGYAATSTSTVSVGATTQTWKATTRAQDTTPDAFAVTAATGVEISTLTSSAAVTPTGYEGTVTVTASNGEVSTDGGTTWGTSKSLSAGGSFRVRATSSASYATTVAATVTVGTGSATTFSVTTRAKDDTPDAIAFTALTGQTVGANVDSEIRQLVNHDGVTVSVSGTNASYRICSDATCSTAPSFVTTSGTAARNAYVQVRQVAPSSGSTATATLTYGTLSTNFSVTSTAAAVSVANFTTCGVTKGPTGPTLAQCQSSYGSSPSITMSTQGKQQWTVPTSGTYRLTVAGAKGGNTPVGGSSYVGGSGFVQVVDVALTSGTILVVQVGQTGVDSTGADGYAGGGGGASVVATGSGTLLVASAGGGGAGYQASGSSYPTITAAIGNGKTAVDGRNGTKSYDGANPAGIDGGAGASCTGGGHTNGAGWLAAGTTYSGYGTAAGALNGTAIGSTQQSTGGSGGFGGGGSGAYGGGGGGGYSGGGCGNYGWNSTPAYRATGGGAGGSYYLDTATRSSTSVNAGAGYVTVSKL